MDEYDTLRNLVNIYFNNVSYLGRYAFKKKLLSEKQIFQLIKKSSNKLENSLKKNKPVGRLWNSSIDKYNGKLDLNSIYENSPIFDYILLGSYADNTFTEESDVDDLIILKKETLKSYTKFKKAKEILSELGLFYQRIDPIQHHGHWIVTEFDMLNYHARFMPPFALKHAKSVGRNINLKMRVNNQLMLQGLRKTFVSNNSFVNSSVDLFFLDRLNLYGFKRMISSMSLLIPVAFQLNGKTFDKKEAIENASQVLDKKSIKVLSWTTRIRREWKVFGWDKFYLEMRILSRFVNNRNTLEFVAKKFSPRVFRKELLGKNELTKKDFKHYLDNLQTGIE